MSSVSNYMARIAAYLAKNTLKTTLKLSRKKVELKCKRSGFHQSLHENWEGERSSNGVGSQDQFGKQR